MSLPSLKGMGDFCYRACIRGFGLEMDWQDITMYDYADWSKICCLIVLLVFLLAIIELGRT